jgi:hypothetical protein
MVTHSTVAPLVRQGAITSHGVTCMLALSMQQEWPRRLPSATENGTRTLTQGSLKHARERPGLSLPVCGRCSMQGVNPQNLAGLLHTTTLLTASATGRLKSVSARPQKCELLTSFCRKLYTCFISHALFFTCFILHMLDLSHALFVLHAFFISFTTFLLSLLLRCPVCVHDAILRQTCHVELFCFCRSVASTSFPPARSLPSLLSCCAGVPAPIPQTIWHSKAAPPRDASIDRGLQERENTADTNDKDDEATLMIAASQDKGSLEHCDELA